MRAACNIAFLAVLIGCFVPSQASGQSAQGGSSNILTCSPAPCVLPPTQVSGGGYAVNSPVIVASPVDGRHLLLGVDDFNCPRGSGIAASFTSKDGGSTWAGPFCMGGISRNGQAYFPSLNGGVAYDREETAYMTADYFDNHSGDTGFIGFEKAGDGLNWSEAAVALSRPNSIASYGWMAADTNLGSPHLNTVYVSAVFIGPSGENSKNQVTVAHSNDGVTWTQRAVAPMQHSPAVDRYTNMVVGKDGTVYIAWMYCNAGPYVCNDHKGRMVLSKSSDGGNSWSQPALMKTVRLLSTLLPNTDVGVTNYPAIGVDNSDGPYAGNLYVVSYNWTGTYMQIGVVRSTDGGKTWLKPVPVAPPSETHDQFFPWLSVSSTGLVGVSWLDRRNDPANIKYQAFAAISGDGGKSFKPNVQLTTAFSDPNNNGDPGNWMGNYTTNTWAGPNHFVAAWMDSSNGVNMQVMIGGIRLH